MPTCPILWSRFAAHWAMGSRPGIYPNGARSRLRVLWRREDGRRCGFKQSEGTLCWLEWGQKRFPLSVGEHVIGRDPDVDVRLDASTVSRRRARFVVTPDRTVWRISGSQDGTLPATSVRPSRCWFWLMATQFASARYSLRCSRADITREEDRGAGGEHSPSIEYRCLSQSAQLGPYEIVGSLGAGGMGEVCRARDPRSAARSRSS